VDGAGCVREGRRTGTAGTAVRIFDTLVVVSPIVTNPLPDPGFTDISKLPTNPPSPLPLRTVVRHDTGVHGLTVSSAVIAYSAPCAGGGAMRCVVRVVRDQGVNV
jgi:hypothetical protein